MDVGCFDHNSILSRSRYRALLLCRSIQFTRDVKKVRRFRKRCRECEVGRDSENLCRSLRYVSEVGKVRTAKDVYSSKWGRPLWWLVEETINESPRCGEEKGIRSER